VNQHSRVAAVQSNSITPSLADRIRLTLHRPHRAHSGNCLSNIKHTVHCWQVLARLL